MSCDRMPRSSRPSVRATLLFELCRAAFVQAVYSLAQDIYVYKDTYISIDTYTYIYTHTYIYTYSYIYMHVYIFFIFMSISLSF